MAEHLYLRSGTKGEVVALGPSLYRKQILRYGQWKHNKAPGGVLTVTKEFVAKIVENFKAGVRDDVPVPMGHERDALTSVGHVIGLEQTDEGLFGIHEIDDPDGKIGKTLTGTSALVALNYEDSETGKEYGPVLIHNALTNAPHMKGLAPFEAVALNEDAEEAVVISLPEEKKAIQEVDMTLEELLAQLEETSDDDLREALKAKRPEFFGSPEGEPTKADDEALEAAAKEAREEVVAALAEKGVTVSLAENDDDKDKTVVDITSAPEFVSLGERVDTLETEKSTEAAEALVDGAIQDGKFLPSQRDGMLEVALSEGGMERVEKLIPEKAIIDLSEVGVEAGRVTNVDLSEEDADDEADRLIASYATSGSKKKE